MFQALAIAALAAVPAQGESLKLTNVRLRVGELGPARDNNRFLPGDILFLAFDVNGLTIDPSGKSLLKMGTRVTDSKGKEIFKREPQDIDHFSPLRGNVLPVRAYILIGVDQDPGIYTLEVTVEDPKSKAKDATSVKFEVLKREFGIVGVYTSYDEPGRVSAPNLGVVGQILVVQFSTVSFDRDPKTKQPKVECQYQFLDEKGTPILDPPLSQLVDGGVDDKEPLVSLRFSMYLNRPGKFTARITATDKVANKKVTYDLPFTVTQTP